MAVSVRNQHVGFPVAQAFQQQPGGRLPDLLAAGNAADLGQADGDAALEQLQVLCGQLARDGGQALVAGHVCGVDQAAEGTGDLAGPDRVRVALGGVLQIAEQVLAA